MKNRSLALALLAGVALLATTAAGQSMNPRQRKAAGALFSGMMSDRERLRAQRAQDRAVAAEQRRFEREAAKAQRDRIAAFHRQQREDDAARRRREAEQKRIDAENKRRLEKALKGGL